MFDVKNARLLCETEDWMRIIWNLLCRVEYYTVDRGWTQEVCSQLPAYEEGFVWLDPRQKYPAVRICNVLYARYLPRRGSRTIIATQPWLIRRDYLKSFKCGGGASCRSCSLSEGFFDIFDSALLAFIVRIIKEQTRSALLNSTQRWDCYTYLLWYHFRKNSSWQTLCHTTTAFWGESKFAKGLCGYIERVTCFLWQGGSIVCVN